MSAKKPGGARPQSGQAGQARPAPPKLAIPEGNVPGIHVDQANEGGWHYPAPSLPSLARAPRPSPGAASASASSSRPKLQLAGLGSASPLPTPSPRPTPPRIPTDAARPPLSAASAAGSSLRSSSSAPRTPALRLDIPADSVGGAGFSSAHDYPDEDLVSTPIPEQDRNRTVQARGDYAGYAGGGGGRAEDGAGGGALLSRREMDDQTRDLQTVLARIRLAGSPAPSRSRAGSAASSTRAQSRRGSLAPDDASTHSGGGTPTRERAGDDGAVRSARASFDSERWAAEPEPADAPAPFDVDPARLVFVRRLGEGTGGSVDQVRDPATGRLMARKHAPADAARARLFVVVRVPAHCRALLGLSRRGRHADLHTHGVLRGRLARLARGRHEAARHALLRARPRPHRRQRPPRPRLPPPAPHRPPRRQAEQHSRHPPGRRQAVRLWRLGRARRLGRGDVYRHELLHGARAHIRLKVLYQRRRLVARHHAARGRAPRVPVPGRGRGPHVCADRARQQHCDRARARHGRRPGRRPRLVRADQGLYGAVPDQVGRRQAVPARAPRPPLHPRLGRQARQHGQMGSRRLRLAVRARARPPARRRPLLRRASPRPCPPPVFTAPCLLLPRPPLLLARAIPPPIRDMPVVHIDSPILPHSRSVETPRARPGHARLVQPPPHKAPTQTAHHWPSPSPSTTAARPASLAISFVHSRPPRTEALGLLRRRPARAPASPTGICIVIALSAQAPLRRRRMHLRVNAARRRGAAAPSSSSMAMLQGAPKHTPSAMRTHRLRRATT